MKITGTLEHWWHEPALFNVIWGHVHNDIEGRFVDGTLIHTSSLKHSSKQVHKEGDIINTQNSTYLLGKPRVFGDGV